MIVDYCRKSGTRPVVPLGHWPSHMIGDVWDFVFVINNIGKIWNGWEKNYLGFFVEIRKPGFQTLNASPSPAAAPS